MQLREIAGRQVPAIGLGCMNLSQGYGQIPGEDDAARLLERALDRGVMHLDTAALYGFGHNEALIGKVLSRRRDEFFLASKCGMTGVNGRRTIDGRPQSLHSTLDEALQRLRTDRIDLYYLHRLDPRVPVEDSIGAMAQMVEAGKVGALGLSEVSAATLRRAHAVHPIAAVQTEYSLWTRNAEIAVLDACRDLGTAFVAFSPLARGFLADLGLDPAGFPPKDLRRPMPRFQAPNFEANRQLAVQFSDIARSAGCSMAQLALAWLLAQGNHILPIPGTRSLAHLEENIATLDMQIAPELLSRTDELINQRSIRGQRYPADVQRDIDTETFPEEFELSATA